MELLCQIPLEVGGCSRSHLGLARVEGRTHLRLVGMEIDPTSGWLEWGISHLRLVVVGADPTCGWLEWGISHLRLVVVRVDPT
jgi:hypothetical protein